MLKGIYTTVRTGLVIIGAWTVTSAFINQYLLMKASDEHRQLIDDFLKQNNLDNLDGFLVNLDYVENNWLEKFNCQYRRKYLKSEFITNRKLLPVS